ncbi:CBS domain-containing protein [Methanobacterium ferruginis]|jgi:CBS domain-containing protein|uniref:CBS domain-containing protein n=1 Tax=Methanobacterium ferruginis TaxID=710191 RepID=UPI0025740A51|nr:CBS domain-containing protein [Methanobacterium ferruginis]BDZ66930.1 inosine-5-monophosphate dehydrogenase [Methanobacterium ferruginis]
MMKVEDVMNEEVVLAGENEQVSHARNLMLKHGYSRILVVDQQGKPVGILTEKDLIRKMRANGPKWKRRTIDNISIRRVMTPHPVTITPFREIREAVELMIKNDISSIPVVDEDEVVGIVTKSDLMDFYLQKYTGKWKVSDLMTSEVITVNENHSIGHVISVMDDKKIGKVIVVRDNEPVGIITSANISFANVEDPETGVSVEKIAFLRKIDGQEKRNVREVSMVTAGDIMTNHLIRIGQDEDAASAADIMVKKDVSGMPVVNGSELMGIITKTDIIRGIQ